MPTIYKVLSVKPSLIKTHEHEAYVWLVDPETGFETSLLWNANTRGGFPAVGDKVEVQDA